MASEFEFTEEQAALRSAVSKFSSAHFGEQAARIQMESEPRFDRKVWQRLGSELGVLGLSDPLRREAPDVVSELRRLGLDVVMLTGDRRATAEAIAADAGIAAVVADVLPALGEPEEVRTSLRRLLRTLLQRARDHRRSAGLDAAGS